MAAIREICGNLETTGRLQPPPLPAVTPPPFSGQESRTLTYRQLLEEVSRCANVLKSLGVGK